MKRASIFLVVLLGSGCAMGPTRSSLTRPASESVTLSLMGGGVAPGGELLEVRPDGLLLGGGALQVFPWEIIRSVSTDRLRGIQWSAGTPPGEKTRERLRLVSRFPQGLDEATTRRLLGAYHQDAIRVCRLEDRQLRCGAASPAVPAG